MYKLDMQLDWAFADLIKKKKKKKKKKHCSLIILTLNPIRNT